MPDVPQRTPGLDTTEIGDDESAVGGLRTRLGRFYFHGQPVYLIQAGTYGLRTDRGYDGRDPAHWRTLIDRLAAIQTDSVRFQIRIDPWAFCFDPVALSPWPRTDLGWNLSAFDDAFWTVLRAAADYAQSREVLVEFVMFNGGTLRIGRGGIGWPHNPFNTARGGFLTRDPAANFFNLPFPDRFDLGDQEIALLTSPSTQVQAAQERFVREVVTRLHGLDNVAWEIASQMEGVDPVREAFIAHFVELLRRVDTLDRVATASVRNIRRADQDLYRLVGIDTVQFWLPAGLEPHEELIEAVSALRSFGKPVIAGESEIGVGYPSLSRASVWQTYVAGGHPCADALLADPSDPSLEAFVAFVSDTAPGALTHDTKLIVSRTEGLHCHGGRAEEGTFVLYATTESPASNVEASLRLSPGRWKATSVSPTTGKVLAEQEIDAARPATQLPLPPFEEDLAVRLVKL